MGKELAPHGTHAAYKRHRRAGEEPCFDCADAARRYSEERRERESHGRAVVIELARGRDADTAVVAQHVGHGKSADVDVPVFEDRLEAARWRLRRVRAAMMVAGPRDVAPLARAEGDVVAEIAELTADTRRPLSALDQLAARRVERMSST